MTYHKKFISQLPHAFVAMIVTIVSVALYLPNKLAEHRQLKSRQGLRLPVR